MHIDAKTNHIHEDHDTIETNNHINTIGETSDNTIMRMCLIIIIIILVSSLIPYFQITIVSYLQFKLVLPNLKLYLMHFKRVSSTHHTIHAKQTYHLTLRRCRI